MATYRIEWKTSAVRDLRRLDRQAVPRIVDSVERLACDPFPVGVKKLQGSRSTYRLRVGMYRVVYEVFAERLVLHVVRARHRKDVYRT